MKSSEEKSEELTNAMQRFRELDEELSTCLNVLRKYMRVERGWIFRPLSQSEQRED